MRELPLAILNDEALVEIIRGWSRENRPMDNHVVVMFEEIASRAGARVPRAALPSAPRRTRVRERMRRSEFDLLDPADQKRILACVSEGTWTIVDDHSISAHTRTSEE